MSGRYSQKVKLIRDIYDEWKTDLAKLIRKRNMLIHGAIKKIESEKLVQLKAEIENE